MKRFFVLCTICGGLLGCGSLLSAQAQEVMTVRTVNLQTCLDASQTGKKELQRFEQMKKHMEEALEAKEKRLNELAPKFTEEYLDSISPEEEKKLKSEFQALSQEFSQEQSSYYQTLNQAQMAILQKMQDKVMQASKAIAKEKNFKLVVRSDACLFADETLDMTADIVAYIDAHPDAETTIEGKETKK